MTYDRSVHSVRPFRLKPPTSSVATDTASQPTPSICNPQGPQSSLAEQLLSRVEAKHYRDLHRFRKDQEDAGILAVHQSQLWKSLKYAEFGTQRLFQESEVKASMSKFLATLERLENMGEFDGPFNYGLGEGLLSQCDDEEGNEKDSGEETSIVGRQLAEYFSQCSAAPTFEKLKAGALSEAGAFYHLWSALSGVDQNRQTKLGASTYEGGDRSTKDEDEESEEAYEKNDGSTAGASGGRCD